MISIAKFILSESLPLIYTQNSSCIRTLDSGRFVNSMTRPRRFARHVCRIHCPFPARARSFSLVHHFAVRSRPFSLVHHFAARSRPFSLVHHFAVRARSFSLVHHFAVRSRSFSLVHHFAVRARSFSLVHHFAARSRSFSSIHQTIPAPGGSRVRQIARQTASPFAGYGAQICDFCAPSRASRSLIGREPPLSSPLEGGNGWFGGT